MSSYLEELSEIKEFEKEEYTKTLKETVTRLQNVCVKRKEQIKGLTKQINLLEQEVDRLLTVIEQTSEDVGKLDTGNVVHRKASIQSVCNLQRALSEKKLKENK